MYTDIISERLKSYKPETELQEENALKEILQEIILTALFEIGFFSNAVFQGGTCLRIFHGLKRFSEDLDFILSAAGKEFSWQAIAKALQKTLDAYGVKMEITDRSRADLAVKKMMLKDSSIGKLLSLRPASHKNKSILIKLEIDTNPPEGSTNEEKLLTFPTSTLILCQDLPSCFAGKTHALLCRKYLKGRDWFDFLWYVDKKIKPNLKFLRSALLQSEEYRERDFEVSHPWLIQTLTAKVKEIDWKKAQQDVAPFVEKMHYKSVENWNEKFFLAAISNFKVTLED